jgi:hypothetical protein
LRANSQDALSGWNPEAVTYSIACREQVIYGGSMSCRPQKLDEIATEYAGVPITVKGVIFYPYESATRDDPAENAMVEWDSVWIGGINVSEIFAGPYLGDRLSEIIINKLEG